METITINLPDQLASKLKEASDRIGVTPEEFVKEGVEEKLSFLDDDFNTALDRVLNKNAELYKRLA
jgi:predicted DNA-binding protein